MCIIRHNSCAPREISTMPCTHVTYNRVCGGKTPLVHLGEVGHVPKISKMTDICVISIVFSVTEVNSNTYNACSRGMTPLEGRR